MSSRLDRLLILLDTGSSTSVRTTAAKQLAQLAAKSVRGDVGANEDITLSRHNAALDDPSAWTELMSVVARILPYLHSKSHETRSAASVALSQMCSLVPLWEPHSDVKPEPDEKLPIPEFPAFSVRQLMESGNLLLASSGKEFAKSGIPADAAELRKAKKAVMGRLGLDFLANVGRDGDDDDMDIDKELAADHSPDTEHGPHTEEKPTIKDDSDSVALDSPTAGSPYANPKKEDFSALRKNSITPNFPEEEMSGLSARERNRLKRKRKQGTSAFVSAPLPSQNLESKYQAAPSSHNNSKARLVAPESPHARSDDHKQVGVDSSSEVVIDPSKGGAVDPKLAAASKALEVHPGQWVWDGVVKILEVDLFSPAWERRHGAAMALRELIKVQGKCGGMKADVSHEMNAIYHENWCNDLAADLLCVIVLDRFGDFVSDQVIAPVRETVSQTLASLMLHMPKRSVFHVHSILLQMIKQDFVLNNTHPTQLGKPSFSKGKSGAQSEKQHVWEVRHAGLLGINYEVSVRKDLVEEESTKVKNEDETETQSGKDVLRGIVDAAVLGLGDNDDDVRAVAASCLLPITAQLVEHLSDELPRVLAVLWACLGDMKDDLNSSVGAVMDLLGQLVTHNTVIDIMASKTTSQPLSTLAPMLFPFFRHTIYTVRLAVVKTLLSFLTVPTLPRDWIDQPCLRLVLQNLVVEERADIRSATLTLWSTLLLVLRAQNGSMSSLVTPQLVLDWYTLVMTPLGVPIDPASLFHPSTLSNCDGTAIERHNVDKNILAQDLGLVSVEIILKARVAAATALALLIAEWPSQELPMEDMFKPMLEHYIQSPSMLQKFLTAVIVEEWSHRYDELVKEGRYPNDEAPLLTESCPLSKSLGLQMLNWLQSEPPVAYHEMALSLSRILADCTNLLQGFAHDCKIPTSSIPSLGTCIDIDGTGQAGYFTIGKAYEVTGPIFSKLKESLGRTKKKEVAALQEKRQKIMSFLERYSQVKSQHDVRISAAFAAAFVSLRLTPDKVSPIVKGIMNGVKIEENIDLQTRSAAAVAAFIEFCSQNKLVQPSEKIVKNLCTFLCQDSNSTPTFAYTRQKESGILSFKIHGNAEVKSNGRGRRHEVETQEEPNKSRLSRRGAQITFAELSKKFGTRLFEVLPKMWEFVAGGLLTALESDDLEMADKQMEKQFGQDVIDSLSVLRVIASTLHKEFWPRLETLLPKLALALRSHFAIIRQCTAQCFATICGVITPPAMRYVIEHIVPYLGDSMSVANRQGAVELVYHIVQELDIKALPYIIFLVVPVLGRMSDVDDDTRSTATNTFASLVKMVPLEAGLPDPPDFPPELLQRRENEREFLTQLLDGSKVEQYDIPIKINAELRKYQQGGVNWLAFLAKYQLHGILCDDMGLGKTLQSICILASKHHERAVRYQETRSPDAVHLPSLIVCPPTLTGHWYYEILKYVDGLKPVMYVGTARERQRLVPKLMTYDVVITSYEVVRNDISDLQNIHWHYCILDEGHIIKNAKTKLTKAVKCIRAHHRLILSGTPIQNNVLELWSLFDFLMPGFLGSEQFFSEKYSKPILANRDGKSKNGEAAALALEALHKQVLPFLLRRLKEDVLHDLPPKIIQDYYCELSEMQKELYDDFSKSQARKTAESAIQSAGESAPGQKHIFQSLQYLRKLCNHPALVLKGDKKDGATENLHDIQHAPKLLALRQLLVDCGIGASPTIEPKSEATESEETSSGAFSQHRVLIFCQLKQMLDIIETDLFKKHMPSVTYMRLDGTTDANRRHAIVQTFNADPSIDCLLLTTHVGGLGLTLTGADTVIFVEHDWNPMKDLQAMDRAHRIGQKKVVNVYRLITKGTLEEKIMGLQRFKLNIANSIVTQQNSGLSSMDTDLVLDLFRHTTQEEDTTSAKKRKEKERVGPMGQKNILEGLEDLPNEEEYDNLNVSSFIGSLER